MVSLLSGYLLHPFPVPHCWAHFPDKLLNPNPVSSDSGSLVRVCVDPVLHQAQNWPVDRIQEWTEGQAVWPALGFRSRMSLKVTSVGNRVLRDLGVSPSAT